MPAIDETPNDGTVTEFVPVPIDGEAATPSTVTPPAAEPQRLISRDEIMAAHDIRWIKVPVDEWKKNAVVWVRTPTASDKDQLEFVILTDGKKLAKDEIRAHYIALCVVKDDGSNERLFTPEDIQWLRNKNAVPMNRIFDAILTSTIVTEQEIDELAKNSGAASGVTT